MQLKKIVFWATNSDMDPVHIFEELRPLLFTTAYKMTKSISDAEDILQEVSIEWIGKNPAHIQSPKSYLIRSVMNRSLTLLDKNKYLVYPGIDLPEPLISARYEFTTGHDISFALLLLLQKLSPAERAVFILKESFDYPYSEMASILEIKEDHCRQLLHRAKEKIGEPKQRFISTPEKNKAFADVFMQAGSTGDLNQLIRYLKEEMVIWSDGGGKVSAAQKPVFGREACLKMLAGISAKRGTELSFYTEVINGQPGIVFYETGTGSIDTIVVLETDGEEVSQMYMVRNPDKFRMN